MGKIYVTLVALLCVTFTNAQVGIGTTTPDGSAELDITSTNRGFLMPRVALTSTTDTATITGAEATGLLVYNTATIADVTPGFYYWDGAQWVTLGGASAAAWELTGNAGTNSATNFIGTTDGQDLAIRTNNIEVLRITPPDASNDPKIIAGNGTNKGDEGDPLFTFDGDDNTGIWSDGADEFSLGAGSQEFLTVDEGPDELIVNEDGDTIDFRVESDNETNMFVVDGGTNHIYVRQISPFPTIDTYTVVSPANDYPINAYASGQGNAGVYARHGTFTTGTNFNPAAAFDGTGFGGGFSTLAGMNVGSMSTGYEYGAAGTATGGGATRAGGFFQNTNGGGTVEAFAEVAGLSGTAYFGGFFDGNQSGGDYAWVGVRSGGTNYKILGGGSVSTIVKDELNKKKVMFAPEAPEILFQDYGDGQLVNGEVYINMDPIIQKNIHVDANSPLRVFIQLEGDCNGVFVSDKSKNGFKVKELAGGTSNTKFTWQIVATRADDIDANGNIDSKHVGVRFPDAPDRIERPFTKGQVKTAKLDTNHKGPKVKPKR